MRPMRETLAVDVFPPQPTVSTTLQYVHQGSYWRVMTLSPPVRNLRSPLVKALRALTMRGAPDITDVHVPVSLLVAAHLPEVYPAPVFACLDLIVRARLDSGATFLQHRILSWSNDPFANPLAVIRPHAEVDLVLPVIVDDHDTTRAVGSESRANLARLRLRRQHGHQQDRYQHAGEAYPFSVHIVRREA